MRRAAKKKGRLAGGPCQFKQVNSISLMPPAVSDGQHMDRAGRAEPDHVRLSGLGVGHEALFRAVVLGQMPYDFADIRDPGGAQRMALRQQTARHVDRGFAAEAGMDSAALVDKLAGLTVAAQAEI